MFQGPEGRLVLLAQRAEVGIAGHSLVDLPMMVVVNAGRQTIFGSGLFLGPVRVVCWPCTHGRQVPAFAPEIKVRYSYVRPGYAS